MMGKILKRIASVCAIAMLVAANLVPILKASAIDNSEEYAQILMRGATDFANDGLEYYFLYNGGTVTVTGFTEQPTVELNENWDFGDHYGNMLIIYTKDDAVTFTTTANAGNEARLYVGGYEVELVNNSHAIENMQANETYDMDFTFDSESGPVAGNTEATVRLSGAGDFTEAVFAINGGWLYQMMPEDAVEGEDYSEATYWYDSDNEDTTVDFVFATLWHLKFNGTITINDVAYDVSEYVDYNDKVSYLDHYAGQAVSFTIEDVLKSDVYEISVDVERNENQFIGNFLWTADPEQKWERNCFFDENDEKVCEYILDENGDKIPGRDYIGNASLALVEILYEVGGINYACNVDTGTCNWWSANDPDDVNSCSLAEEDCSVPYVEFYAGSENYDDGSLVIPAGAFITMRIIPDYGYQVMNVNMSELTTSEDGIGEFTFEVPGGAAYFVADVVPVEDVVNAKTDLVASGSIALGNGQTTLTHGSARLDVDDVELTDENKALFEEAVDGYEIKNYLDISLYNMTCRGAETCTGSDEDSWNEQIRDLNEPATITLQLEDGVDGNDIVIVHEKHDGTYEILDTTYDVTTNTISFMTTSFSNYAIASRTVDTPDTGEITNSEGKSASAVSVLPILIVTGIIAVAGGIAIVIKNKSKK